MPKKPSSYYRPKSLKEALGDLRKPDTKPLAGGTMLLANGTDSAVVDLQDLGLDQIEFGQGKLTAGAMTRLTDLSRYISEVVQNEGAEISEGVEQLLLDSIHRSGPNTFRNAATVGGIVASRLADSEFLAALLVLDAEITLLDQTSLDIELSDYLAAAHRPVGLISELTIPWHKGISASDRVARTPADYPIVSVTVFKPVEGQLRVAATGIDLRPVRVEKAEAAFASGAGAEEVAQAAKDRTRHTGDFRGDTGYRSEMAFVLTKRLLGEIG
jgi:CO/xanthine dehydrogenase FAD-binding subunit